MSQVPILINGHTYNLACDPGQEDHLVKIGDYLNTKVKEISQSGAARNESHLLILSAIIMTDELFKSHDVVQGLREEIKDIQSDQEASGKFVMTNDQEAQLIKLIEGLTSRVNSIAEKLEDS